MKTETFGLGPVKVERRKRPPKGRKFWLTAWIFAVPFLACTVALFRGHMSDTTYVGFLQIQIPVCLTAFHAANVAQKVGLAKAQADAPPSPQGSTVNVEVR